MNTEEKKSLDQKQDFIIETLFEYFKNGVDIMFENQAASERSTTTTACGRL